MGSNYDDLDLCQSFSLRGVKERQKVGSVSGERKTADVVTFFDRRGRRVMLVQSNRVCL